MVVRQDNCRSFFSQVTRTPLPKMAAPFPALFCRLVSYTGNSSDLGDGLVSHSIDPGAIGVDGRRGRQAESGGCDVGSGSTLALFATPDEGDPFPAQYGIPDDDNPPPPFER